MERDICVLSSTPSKQDKIVVIFRGTEMVVCE